MMPSQAFVDLDKSLHDRKTFDCGAAHLNEFLQQHAVRHYQSGISKTWVLPADDERSICAFYTLSHTEIERMKLPANIAKRLPRYPIPVMLIAQLGTHKELQGRGIGKITLIRALERCAEINKHLPSFAVVVDLLDEQVRGFYEQFGFQELDHYNGRVRLYLPMKAVIGLFE